MTTESPEPTEAAARTAPGKHIETAAPAAPTEPTGPAKHAEPAVQEPAAHEPAVHFLAAEGPVLPRSQLSLADAVREIERHVGSSGWDGPVRVFALVGTARGLAASPELADQLSADVVAAARDDDTHLTSIEQEGLPDAADLEELLGGITWPDSVEGAAITVERVILSHAAEETMPADPQEALTYLMGHPDRQDVRMAVGALRTGESWSAIRTRANDADDAVAMGPDLVPGLLEALRATLA